MTVIEQAQRALQKLPAHLQIEALDFIEYLLTKAKRLSKAGQPYRCL
jgi:hypothetical protein